MNRKQKKIVRILALVLAALLAIGAVVTAVVSMASAEELPATDRNRMTMKIEYMEEEQALRITQRLVYINTSAQHLDRVMFRVLANTFRRMDQIFYEDDLLEAAFPYGYLPGGIDLTGVRVNDADADWGYSDYETELRVACDLQPGEQCTFEFDYYLLLTQNSTFLGIGKNSWRLSDFYLAPESFDDATGEFICQTPVTFTRTVDSPAADWTVEISLPDSCILTGTGAQTVEQGENRMNTWTVTAQGVHDFSLCFGAKYKTQGDTAGSGVNVECCTCTSGKGKDAVKYAVEAIEACEEMFGSFPFSEFDIMETELAEGSRSMSGTLWLSADVMKDADTLKHAVRYAVAQQYFGFTAYARVSEDAWLSDSICEYITYLITERTQGHDAYLKQLNEGVVDSLQYTIPGGYMITTNASLMTRSDYEALIRDRGAAVFHEMSVDMGMDGLIAGLRAFYEMGLARDVLTEMNLVEAFDSSTGGNWEKDLTDWVFNIGDYVNQTIDWLD